MQGGEWEIPEVAQLRRLEVFETTYVRRRLQFAGMKPTRVKRDARADVATAV